MQSVSELLALASFNFNCEEPYLYLLSWNSVGIPVKYLIKDENGNTIYNEYKFKPVDPGSAGNCYFFLNFEPFNVLSGFESAGTGCK
jgi:hypothetical protein